MLGNLFRQLRLEGGSEISLPVAWNEPLVNCGEDQRRCPQSFWLARGEIGKSSDQLSE